MSFAPGSTPVLGLILKNGDEDLTQVSDITVDFATAAGHIVKSGTDVTVLSPIEAEVTLTQQDTLQLIGGWVKIQMNWLYPGTALRWNTGVARVRIDEQLHMSVIGGGGA